jgi:ABC-type multidrug transport system fused ATPase/permease subunit
LRALGYLKQHWLIASGAPLGLLVSTGANVATPRLTQTILDQGISAGDMAIVIGAVFGMLGLSVLGAIFTFLQGVLSACTAQGVAYDMLTRLYDVDEGAVLIDGHDIRDVTFESLRRHIGIVLQDTFLFSGTVMENIRYGRLDASDEEVIAAAELANAHQFITCLPDGYQTELGERGHSLSQGQRQLLAIARAVLVDPRILVLDEATSNVDTRTELLIQRALDGLLKGRMSFMIAHRLSTIRNADRVIVLQEGRVAERGTHEEQLAAQRRHYETYNTQFHRQPAEQLAEMR